MYFSIITPCYNSTKTLRKTYQSLLSQEDKDFEWILIDDASPDEGETRKLIEELADEAPFPVKYKFLSHNHFGAKSVYTGASLASGKYACILDHDDELIPTALSSVKKLVSAYEINENASIAGVCGRCVDENHDLIGKPFRKACFLATEGEVRFNLRNVSELFQFTKVELLKLYFDDLKPGYTNGYSWAKLSKKFKYLYTNEVVRVYDTYNPESFSNSSSQRVTYPENRSEAIQYTIKIYAPYLHLNPIYSLKICSSYIRHCILSKKNILAPKMPMFFYMTLPISLILGFLKSKNYI